MLDHADNMCLSAYFPCLRMEKLLEAALDVPFSLASKIFSGFDITVFKNHAERRVCLKGRREEAKEATKKK